jgi:lysophospholipase L1-like esterase
VFGDSLSANQFAPGQVMASKLGAGEVRVNARVGRSANNFWAREDTAKQLAEIRAWQPDTVIVVLGTNDIGLSMKADGQKMREIKTALEQGGAEVWAFGPPSFPAGTREANGVAPVVTMMRDVFGAQFIDLRPITKDLVSTAFRSQDKIHFTASGGTLAGTRMARSFIEADATPSDGWMLAAAAVAAAAYFLFR